METYLYFIIEMTKAGIMRDTINMSFIMPGSGKMLWSPFSKGIMKKGKMEYVCLKGSN